LPEEIAIRQALASDSAAIHALLRPFVMQRLLLSRSEAEIIELTRHGFVAHQWEDGKESQLIGFSAVEIYSPKLAELQCLAVHSKFQGTGVGRVLVSRCVQRARELNVMELHRGKTVRLGSSTESKGEKVRIARPSGEEV